MTARNIVPQVFDYGALDPDARGFVLERAERIHNIARMTAKGIALIGEHLAEVKGRLQHGQFLQWIEREFGWAERSARRFMEVYAQVKSANLADLQIDVSALYLIAAPSTPDPARAEVMRRAESGEVVTRAGARALVKRFEESGELPEAHTSLYDLVAEQRRKMGIPTPPLKPLPPPLDEKRLREEYTAAMAEMTNVIQSMERIATTNYTMAEVARHIQKFNSPDVDWPGKAKESSSRMKALVALMKE